MSANTETCANRDKSACDYNEFRRLRYFHGMLLDEKDFREEQQYHANKRRLLNRMLHGSGVVCGLELRGRKGKRAIEITTGLALDCSGNEIWVSKDLKIDLASLLPPKNEPTGGPKCKPVDGEDKLKTYYIGIRYDEKPTNPVSVYLPSGDCEERTCENSRWKEGYCVEIVECCSEDEPEGLLTSLCQCDGNVKLDKEKYTNPCGKCGSDPRETNDKAGAANANPVKVKEWCECMVFEEFCEQSVPCPGCCSCDHPCHVILGQIKVDPKTGLLVTVCMNECRRYVLTGRLVQQAVLGVVAGAEDRLQVKVGEDPAVNVLEEGEKFSDFIYNPIKAVCRWLFYQVRIYQAKKGGFEWLDCERKKSEPTVEVIRREFEQKLTAQRELVTNFFLAQQKTNEVLSERLSKIQPAPVVDNVPPVVDAPAPVAVEPAPAADKKDAAEKAEKKEKKEK